MWFLCSNHLADRLAKESEKATAEKVQPVSELQDITVTINNKGLDYFEPLQGIIVLDNALDTLTDISVLNQVASIQKPIYFIYRADSENAIPLNLLKANVVPVKAPDAISLNKIAQIINGGVPR